MRNWKEYKYSLGAIVLFVWTFIAGSGLIAILRKTPLKIAFDVSVLKCDGNAGCYGQFYYDAGAGFSERQSVKVQYAAKNGQYAHYEVVLPTLARLSSLRFDPLPAGGTVLIRNMRVKKYVLEKLRMRGGKLTPLHSIKSIKDISGSNGGVLVEMGQDDPQLLVSSDIDGMVRLNWRRALLIFFHIFLVSLSFFLVVAFILSIRVKLTVFFRKFVARATAFYGRLAVTTAPFNQLVTSVFIPALAVFIISVEGLLCQFLNHRLGGVWDASESVGLTNYQGYPKSANLNLYILCVFLCIAIGISAGLAFSRSSRKGKGIENPYIPTSFFSLGVLAPIILLFIYAACIFPNIQSGLSQIVSGNHINDVQYDSTNIVVWQYLVHRGWLPLRDFWYPYGGFFNFGAGGWFPIGFLREYGHRIILMGIALASLWRLLAPSLRKFLLVAIPFIGASALGYFPGESRYFIALDIVLLFLAARASYRIFPFLMLSVLATYGFYFEPNQIGYGLISILPIFSIDMFFCDSKLRKSAFRNIIISSIAGVFGFIAILLYLWRQGRLHGLIDFLMSEGSMTIYGSIPANLPHYFGFQANSVTPVFWVALSLTMMGAAFMVFSCRTRSLGASAFSIGILCSMVIMKLLVRPPGMAPEISPYIVVGIFLTIAQALDHLQFFQRMVLAFVVGFYSNSLPWGDILERLKAMELGLHQLPAHVRLLKTLPSNLRTIEMDYFENQKRYSNYEAVISRLKQLMSKNRRNSHRKLFYVLGDDALLYVALRQKPPYYITIYNMSPMSAQMNTVGWLKRKRPDWVVWRPSFELMDNVPNTVRVPLVYEYIVKNYVPFERIGDFNILERRHGSDGRIDFAFWANQLGRSLELGAVPSVSGLRAAHTCDSNSCLNALKIKTSNPIEGKKVEIPIGVAAQNFLINFVEQRDVYDYYINLDHVWFYNAAVRAGLTPSIGISANATLVRLEKKPVVLW